MLGPRREMSHVPHLAPCVLRPGKTHLVFTDNVEEPSATCPRCQGHQGSFVLDRTTHLSPGWESLDSGLSPRETRENSPFRGKET